MNPRHANAIVAFREFRRSVGELAADEGIDLVLVVDGQKRAGDVARVWWIEGSDAADQRLRDLSDASTAAVRTVDVVPAYGREEREGRLVVRTYLDIAPSDADAARPAAQLLWTRLRTDPDYYFAEVPAPGLGADKESARAEALATADLVVVFLSPAYVEWRRSAGPDRPPPGRVALVCWSELGERIDQVLYPGTRRFGADAVGQHGLDGLSRRKLGDRMNELHSELVRTVEAPPRFDRMVVFARLLAVADELDPINVRGLSGRLDKGTTAPLSDGPAVDVVERLLAWATTTSERPYFVVFGEYGMGKTVTTQTFTRRLLERREVDRSAPLPIYFDLRT